MKFALISTSILLNAALKLTRRSIPTARVHFIACAKDMALAHITKVVILQMTSWSTLNLPESRIVLLYHGENVFYKTKRIRITFQSVASEANDPINTRPRILLLFGCAYRIVFLFLFKLFGDAKCVIV